VGLLAELYPPLSSQSMQRFCGQGWHGPGSRFPKSSFESDATTTTCLFDALRYSASNSFFPLGNDLRGSAYQIPTMNATKRKFNALLNGIGTKSTTNVSSTGDSNAKSNSTAGADLQAKKRRLADTLLTKESDASVSQSSSPSTMRDKNIRSMIGPTETGDAPKYAPWDRTAFLQRLKSFSNLTDWTPKPAKVNEVEWAKRGWVCQKQERVRCSLCNIEILVKLNRKEVDGKEVPVYVAQNIGTLSMKVMLQFCLRSSRGCPGGKI
jgi:hypothetical protein